MRSFYALAFLLQIAATVSFAAVLQPELVDNGPCDLEDGNLDHCLLSRVKANYPRMLRGIPELKFPKLQPLEIPTFEVNNEIGNVAKIDAKLKNVRIDGFEGIVFEQVTFDAKDLIFTIKLFFPLAMAELEYDVKGHMFNLSLENRGLLSGNFSDTTFEAIVALTKFERNGVEYFRIRDMAVQSRIGNGAAKLLSKNPNFQPAADLMMNFYNNNPRLFMDTVNPMYVRAAEQFLTAFFNPVLGRLPISSIF